MSEKLPTLRDMKANYSPEVSPFMGSVTVPVRKTRVRSGLSERPLVDGESGEVVAASVIHQIQDMDSDQFVKVFAAGIAAAYDLGRTGQRVFQAILQKYEETPMHGGFADAVYLVWFDQGLSGQSIGMSEKTFNRGLRELLDKSFIAARTPGIYWVNPALFFKGDRVMLVKEYRRAARLVHAPSGVSISATAHVVAPGGGASRPREPDAPLGLKLREMRGNLQSPDSLPTKPQNAPDAPSLSAMFSPPNRSARRKKRPK